MPPDASPWPLRDALIAAMERFAATQSEDSLAKLFGFFHLAQPGSDPAIELAIEASGVIVLSIQVQVD